MQKRILVFIGVVLILTELSGLPRQWKTIYGVVAGIVLIAAAIKKDGNFSASQSGKENEDSSFKKVMVEDSPAEHAEGNTGRK